MAPMPDEIDLYNDAADPIPSGGLCAPTGGYTSEGFLKVGPPTADSQGGLLVCAEFSILPGGVGRGGHVARGVLAYDRTAGIPANGDSIGSVAGSFYAAVGKTGWKAIGTATNVWVMARRADGLASPLTTKGDLWGYGLSDDRFPVGSHTNGQVLTLNSSALFGFDWASIPTATITVQDSTNVLITYPGVSTLQVEPGTGLTLSQPASGKAKIGLQFATSLLPGSVSITTQTLKGAKTFPDVLTAQTGALVGASSTTGPTYFLAAGGVCASGYPQDVSFNSSYGFETSGGEPYLALDVSSNADITPSLVYYSYGGAAAWNRTRLSHLPDYATGAGGKSILTLEAVKSTGAVDAVLASTGGFAVGDHFGFSFGVTGYLGPGSHATGGMIDNIGSGSFVSLGSANTWTATQTFAPTTNVVPVVSKSSAGGTADLFQSQNSSGTVLAKIDVSGNLTAVGGTFGAAVGVTGTVTATTFSGSGASLTNLPASALTGTVDGGTW